MPTNQYSSYKLFTIKNKLCKGWMPFYVYFLVGIVQLFDSMLTVLSLGFLYPDFHTDLLGYFMTHISWPT